MRAFSGQRGQVLILLAAYMFFGGAASTILLHQQAYSPRELKKAVASVVADESRRSAAQSEIGYWAKLLKSQNKELGKAQKKFVKLARRHDATRADADRMAADMDASILQMDRRFLDARFRLKEQVTQSEWDAMWVHLKD